MIIFTLHEPTLNAMPKILIFMNLQIKSFSKLETDSRDPLVFTISSTKKYHSGM